MSVSKPPKMSQALTTGSPIKQKPSQRLERQTNFKVVIRCRPPLPRELTGEIPFQNTVAVDGREQQITVSENIEAVLDDDGNLLVNPGPYTTHTFIFDYVYSQDTSQKKVFETTARPVVDSALQGYNATIFAYGQTGTGKTFTMEGFNREGSIEARGIIPRAIEQIFGHIQRHASQRMRFLVRASYLQIYNEQISDLLKPERSNLTIREDKKRGVFVDGLSEWVVRSPAEIYGLMERGGAVRATGETKMNEVSSRSHAVFIVIAEQSETLYVDDRGKEMSADEFQRFMHGRGVRREHEIGKLEDHVRQSFKVGKLNLVDLAGSERVRLSGATGQRLEESKQINRSLSALGNVISALTDAKSRQHVPYRDSKLTRMLEDSLGGNCKTTMMAMISPAFEAMQETISTLKFANRAKNIRNEARVNEDLDQKSLLRKYERELKKLRAELEERSKNLVDKRRLLEVDEQRRRAEADKMTAIRALEARSLEFMQEKEEKKKLEQRISMLMGQMIRGPKGAGSVEGAGGGGAAGEGAAAAPELQEMMKAQQDKLRSDYEFKLADLERERETIEEEKAQVDRYKQLLLKQRDIMIALTQRLVERDEQITALQDELDAYDRHHRELEEKLDQKTAMLIRYQRISMEVNANSPYKHAELGGDMENWTGEGVTATGGETRRSKVGQGTSALEVVEEEEESGGGMQVQSTSSLPSSTSPPSSSSSEVLQLRAQVAALERRLATVGPGGAGASEEDSASTSSAAALAAARLRTENLQLKQQLKQLSATGRGKPEDASSTESQQQNQQLQARCATLVREREAVQTIMEQKIKVLVQSVALAANSLLSGAGQGPTQSQQQSAAGQALAKDIASLQHLVGASITALRNAAVGGTYGTSSAPPPPPPALSPASVPSSPFHGNGSTSNIKGGGYGTVGTSGPGNGTGGGYGSAATTRVGGTSTSGLPHATTHGMSNGYAYGQAQNQGENNRNFNGTGGVGGSWGAKDNYFSAGDALKRL